MKGSWRSISALNGLARWVIVLLALSLLDCQPFVAQAELDPGVAPDQAPPAPASEEPTVAPAIPAQELPEVMTRGPVHEAFAEPVNMQVQEGLVVPIQPPPDIEEIPPAERPEGDQFSWVPGYWAWDVDRKGFIWVGGCWRATPPGRYWVSGSWTQVPGGWQWVAGFWAPVDAQGIEYLPAPPAVDDVQPPGSPPDPDFNWVPPSWYWHQGQYVRRPGYWLATRPDWVWMPSHYIWTPRGYVMVEGHWDYPLERRGVLFAPVCFPPSLYGRPGIVYSPSAVIDASLLTVSLFAYPRYCHYYFGDFYDDEYIRIGIYPWFDQVRIASWCDPIFEFDRWRFQRTDPHWEQRERLAYDQRRAQRDLRPARTQHEQDARAAALPLAQQRTVLVIQPLNVAVAHGTLPVRFEKINADARHEIARQAINARPLHAEQNHGPAVEAGRSDDHSAKEHKPQIVPPVFTKVPVAPPPVSPPPPPNTFGDYQSHKEVQQEVERARQSRQASVPATPPRAYTPPPVAQPKVAAPPKQPVYTPPPVPLPVKGAPPPQRKYTPPVQPTLFPDATSDTDAKQESSRGHRSMGR